MVIKLSYRWQVIGYYCEILGLALWIGGLLMIMAAVIPAVFNSFGMEPAGRFLRRVFDGYSQITLGIMVFLLGMGAVRFWQGQSSTQLLFPLTRLEVFLLGSMAVVTFLIGWVLGPRAVALQELAFQAATEIEKKTAFDDFFRLHMMVRALHLTNIGLAVGLLIFKLRKGLTVRVSF